MSNRLKKFTSKPNKKNTFDNLNSLYSKSSPYHGVIKHGEDSFIFDKKKVSYDDFFFNQYGVITEEKEPYLAYLIYVMAKAIMSDSEDSVLLQKITEMDADFMQKYGDKMEEGLSYLQNIMDADLDSLNEFDATLRMSLDMIPTEKNERETELQLHLLILYYASRELFFLFFLSQIQFLEQYTIQYLNENSSSHILRFDGKIYPNKELYAILKAHEIIIKIGMELHKQLDIAPSTDSIEDYMHFEQLNETVSKCLANGYFIDYMFAPLAMKKAIYNTYCSSFVYEDFFHTTKAVENGIYYIYKNDTSLYHECKKKKNDFDKFTLHDVAFQIINNNSVFKNTATMFDAIKDMMYHSFFHLTKFTHMKDISDKEDAYLKLKESYAEKENNLVAEKIKASNEKEKMQLTIDSLNETIRKLTEEIKDNEKKNVEQIKKAHSKNEEEYKRNNEKLKERIKNLEQSIREKDKKIENDADIIKRLSIENKELNGRIFELFMEEDDNSILMTEEKLEKIREKKILVVGGRYDMGARLLKNRNVSVTQIDDVSELARVSTDYDLYVICTRFCAHITQEKADSMFLDKNKKMYFNGTNEDLFLLELYDFISKKNI